MKYPIVCINQPRNIVVDQRSLGAVLTINGNPDFRIESIAGVPWTRIPADTYSTILQDRPAVYQLWIRSGLTVHDFRIVIK